MERCNEIEVDNRYKRHRNVAKVRKVEGNGLSILKGPQSRTLEHLKGQP